MAEKYVDNKKFKELIIEYQNSRSRKSYNEIGKILLLMCNKLLNKSNYSKYTPDRKDIMISDCCYLLFKNKTCDEIDFDITGKEIYVESNGEIDYSSSIDLFESDKDNPLSYFTTAINNSFLQTIAKQKLIEERYISLDTLEQSSNIVVKDSDSEKFDNSKKH